MLIDDRVYGKQEVTEPVLMELIDSRPLQRLKKIAQAGATIYILPKRDVTRFEHSVGVMLLLRMLGATIEEQIAGLLHDVPHTAFSHVADFVFKSKDYDFHDKYHEKIIMGSEIPEILRKHGHDARRIIDESNFPLLEKKIPDLCADRVDYTLRDMSSFYNDSAKAKSYLGHFIVDQGEIIIDDKETAITFAHAYLDMDEGSWANPKEIAAFEIMAQAIRLAIDKGILAENEMFEDDEFVYAKLHNCGDQEILDLLGILNPAFEITLNKDMFSFFSKTKLRYIDPKFMDCGTLRRVSDVSSDYAQRLHLHKKAATEGYFIKIQP